MKKHYILFSIILLIISCRPGNTEQLVTVENRYSISLPSFLIKAGNSLNENASLQYQNIWKEFYVIVIDELQSDVREALIDNELTDTYSDDLKGYSELLLYNFGQSIKISHKSDIVDTLINNMPAKVLTIKGETEGLNIFYSLAFIQGKERYYQVMTWTSAKQENTYKDKMNKILYSFKEL